MTAPLLQIDELRTHFFTEDGVVRAVDGVSFALQQGETLGLVGESGCGKSVTALSIMRLLPRTGRVVGGSVRFESRDLLALPEPQMRQIRGNLIGMIFQEPMTSLNPVHTIGEQVAEAARIHQDIGRAAARARAEEVLRLVRIPDPTRRLRDYPHQFSGGMRQRAMIAMALVCSPRLLIADEPTTALDVTIQAQILRLMLELKARIGAGVLMITHDLGVVAETCERVIVMYAGRVVEEAPVQTLFDNPMHPYTRGLLASMPRGADRRRRRLPEIPGVVPSLSQPVTGCAFAPRCPMAIDVCRATAPELRSMAAGHRVACLRAEAA
ncbi:MAG TPA: ABC transporter ATP-binding protein [Acetobacteraceae bacterium]|nr:ABC transporter ATP-binding protein [Acetobacteraceae bacterium]